MTDSEKLACQCKRLNEMDEAFAAFVDLVNSAPQPKSQTYTWQDLNSPSASAAFNNDEVDGYTAHRTYTLTVDEMPIHFAILVGTETSTGVTITLNVAPDTIPAATVWIRRTTVYSKN